MFCLVVGDVGPLERPGGGICEIPMEQPTKFDLVLKLKTAKTLSLMIPSSMQLLADEVIE
jgi:hypothetical protein